MGKNRLLPHRRLSGLSALLAVALLGNSVSQASAGTISRLHEARAKLASLTADIRAEEAQSSTLQAQLVAVDTTIAVATKKSQQIASDLGETQSQLASARTEYRTLHERLNSIARTAYEQGAGSAIEVVLGATSINDLNDSVQFLSVLSQQTSDLANQVANLAGHLATVSKHLGALLSEQRALLAQLNQERQAKAAAVLQVRESLSQLNTTRTRIVSLVASLRKQLRVEELASVGASFQGAHNLAYGKWAGLFLRTMGVSMCHSNFVALVSWQLAEFTQSAWNPLATTYPMPGSTTYNWAGVQNYVSSAQGLQATRLTIRGGLYSHGYEAIVSALSTCADPMTTAREVNASDWCRGCAGGNYVTDMIAKVEANYSVYAAL